MHTFTEDQVDATAGIGLVTADRVAQQLRCSGESHVPKQGKHDSGFDKESSLSLTIKSYRKAIPLLALQQLRHRCFCRCPANGLFDKTLSAVTYTEK